MNLQSTYETVKQNLKGVLRGLTDEMQQCIEICQLCHKTCEQIMPYCLEKGGMHAERRHIEALSVCADICRTSSHFMMWNSELHTRVCGICADACLKCAEDCERMSNDSMMKMCADVCRACAESCQKMAHTH